MLHFAAVWWQSCILEGSGAFPVPTASRPHLSPSSSFPTPLGQAPHPRCCSARWPPPAPRMLPLIPITELLPVAATSSGPADLAVDL